MTFETLSPRDRGSLRREVGIILRVLDATNLSGLRTKWKMPSEAAKDLDNEWKKLPHSWLNSRGRRWFAMLVSFYRLNLHLDLPPELPASKRKQRLAAAAKRIDDILSSLNEKIILDAVATEHPHDIPTSAATERDGFLADVKGKLTELRDRIQAGAQSVRPSRSGPKGDALRAAANVIELMMWFYWIGCKRDGHPWPVKQVNVKNFIAKLLEFANPDLKRTPIKRPRIKYRFKPGTTTRDSTRDRFTYLFERSLKDRTNEDVALAFHLMNLADRLSPAIPASAEQELREISLQLQRKKAM